MNLKEAYSILEISSDATTEEAKKKYRELTRKYHPDVNKEAGAEDKFKKINEAYHCVQNGKGTDREEPVARNPFEGFGFGDIFGRQQPQYQEMEPIQTQTTVSFQESILGCKRDISFNRKVKCSECNGNGHIQLNNGCDKCGGRGQITGRQGMMMFTRTCDKCGGRIQTKACSKCDTKGVLDASASVQVTVPGGVSDGVILRLGGMGHYVGSFMGMGDQHSDVFLRISVVAEPGLSLDGKDVVSNVNVSLLEALRGCTKTIKTIMGDKEIEIKAMSKHKDEVILPYMGVNRIGNQRIILNIDYPKNVNQLIDVLVQEEK